MMNKFDIFEHVAISAGAGSGKTYTLSRRYINILVGFNLFYEGEEKVPEFSDIKPARPLDVVTITYTEAGALEMKSRIFSLIQSVLAYCDNNLSKKHDDFSSIQEAFKHLKEDAIWINHIKESLTQALSELSSATISTIHSYCLELIEQYGDFLKLDAKPQIIGDDEKIVAYTDAYRFVINNEKEIVKEMNQTISLYKLSQIAQKYSFDAQFRKAFNTYVALCEDTEFSLRSRWMATVLPAYKEIIEEGLRSIEAFVIQDATKADYCDALIANAITILQGEGEWHEYPGQLRKNKKMQEETFEAIKAFRDTLEQLRWAVFDPDAEKHYAATLQLIHALFVKVYDKFRYDLHAKGYTDFETILEQADKLLEHDIALNTRYFMVDEFQDTNSYQWGIITKAAAKNSANVFIVGDEKQSIFAFQGADVSVFSRAACALGIDTPLSMEINRRSDRSVIAFVNEVFASAMAIKEPVTLEPLQLDGSAHIQRCVALFNQYINENCIQSDFEAHYEPLATPIEKGEGSVAILATPVDQTVEDCKEECDTSLQELRHIASFIYEITQGLHPQYSDVTQAYKEGKKAIAVLFDARKQMLPLKQCLLELGLRAKVSDSGNFFDTKEVHDIFIVLKLLTIMDQLDWDNLYAKEKYIIIGALRSNILRLDGDGIHKCFINKELPVTLNRWRDLASYYPLDKLISTILEESALLHLYRHVSEYEQRSANIEKLLDMAYEYSLHEGSDLKSFCNDLEAFIHDENVSEEEALVIEEGVNSIEIVTMHGSKGLEWPLVIIGSMHRSFLGMSKQENLVYDKFEDKELVGFKVGTYEPLVYKFIKERINQKHLAERKRLFYVAMTRPEHHLVLSSAINRYKKGVRLCFNCGNNNYFSLVSNVLGIDYEELYAQTLKEIKNIPIFYPGQWRGNGIKAQKIEAINPPALQALSFENFQTIRPSGKVDPLAFLDEDIFDAASAGIVVHKILEKEWDRLEDDEIYQHYFHMYDVPKNFEEMIKCKAKSFLQTSHYEKLKSGAKGYFEYDFIQMVDNNYVRGSIDLFYFDQQANGWVVVDFKTTALAGRDPQTVMIEHGYDKQLEFYGTYLQSVIGDEKVVSKEICWLI